ncbi:MAG: PP2C family protein-serine/threonine phosphatase [Longimicrobiales bacterium]
MLISPSTDLTPLPPAVQTLLDSFEHCHAGADPRLLTAEGAGWVCLYPHRGIAEPCRDRDRVPIRLAGGPALAIDTRAGATRPGELEFLAHVVTRALEHELEARSAARELSERYEEINLLYLISEVLASMLSLEDAATRILTEVADVLGARRASLWVYDPQLNRLHLAAAVGEDGLRGPISADDTESATAWVFREKQPLNLERDSVLSALPRLEPRPHGREAFLSVPINYTPPEGTIRTVGVITLVGRRSNVRFSAGDERLLSAIASQIGAALETQRLVQESLRQERMMRELELAHDLQLKLLPDPATIEAPPDVAARCVPAESVGGDFYQLFRLPGNRLGLMIGDVSSHGFSAALIMALTLSAVSIYALESGTPAVVLRRVDEALAHELESTEMFLSLFYGVLDLDARELTYVSAGHPHAFRVGTDGTVIRLGATHPPLGMVPIDSSTQVAVPWPSQEDLLLLFTDGLSDALATDGTSTGGEARLVGEVTDRRAEPLTEILDHVFESAAATQPSIPSDDRTAMLVRG